MNCSTSLTAQRRWEWWKKTQRSFMMYVFIIHLPSNTVISVFSITPVFDIRCRRGHQILCHITFLSCHPTLKMQSSQISAVEMLLLLEAFLQRSWTCCLLTWSQTAPLSWKRTYARLYHSPVLSLPRLKSLKVKPRSWMWLCVHSVLWELTGLDAFEKHGGYWNQGTSFTITLYRLLDFIQGWTENSWSRQSLCWREWVCVIDQLHWIQNKSQGTSVQSIVTWTEPLLYPGWPQQSFHIVWIQESSSHSEDGWGMVESDVERWHFETLWIQKKMRTRQVLVRRAAERCIIAYSSELPGLAHEC